MLSYFVAIVVTLLGAWVQPHTHAIHYRIKPVPTADRTSLEITVHFKADSADPIKIKLPTDCFGTPDIHRYVTSFKGEANTVVKMGDSEIERVVQPSADGTVSLRYVLSYAPEVMDEYAFAVNTSNNHFHVAGCQWLLHIGDNDNQKHSISVEIVDAPKNWRLYSSIDRNAPQFKVVDSYERLASSVIGGGGQAHFFKVRQKPVSVFVHGKFDIPSKEIFSAAERIVRLQRRWFADYEQPFYSIIIAPRGGVISGYAPDNAFICFVKRDITREELNVLLAHELFHNWLPNKLSIQQDKKYSGVRYEWFSEGFTDYFARKILLEARLLTPEKFAALINKDIYNIADNPHGKESYDELITAIRAGKYGPAYKKLSYYRGALIALKWDSQLRREGGNRDLSDFIRELYRLAAKGGGKVSEQAFFDLAANYGIDAKSDLERYIMRGELIPVAQGALGDKFELRETEKPSFDPGFSLEQTFRTRKISGVVEDGAAYRAGLRNGMELLRIQNSNRFGNAWYPDKPLTVVVKADGRERTFEFFPYGRPLKFMWFYQRES